MVRAWTSTIAREIKMIVIYPYMNGDSVDNPCTIPTYRVE
jgi:hypothetical protein